MYVCYFVAAGFSAGPVCFAASSLSQPAFLCTARNAVRAWQIWLQLAHLDTAHRLCGEWFQ